MSPQNEEQNDSTSHDPNIGDGASTAMLDAATHGQVLDNNNDSGQEKADEMDDSLRVDTQAMNAAGPAPASAENLPRELTDPSDRAFTLPEEQTPNQG